MEIMRTSTQRSWDQHCVKNWSLWSQLWVWRLSLWNWCVGRPGILRTHKKHHVPLLPLVPNKLSLPSLLPTEGGRGKCSLSANGFPHNLFVSVLSYPQNGIGPRTAILEPLFCRSYRPDLVLMCEMREFLTPIDLFLAIWSFDQNRDWKRPILMSCWVRVCVWVSIIIIYIPQHVKYQI